jgi:hypothetical protein
MLFKTLLVISLILILIFIPIIQVNSTKKFVDKLETFQVSEIKKGEISSTKIVLNETLFISLEKEIVKIKKIEEQKKVISKPKPIVIQPIIQPVTTDTQYAKQRVCEVFGCDHWDSFYFIIQRESSWNYKAINPTSGAGGLCQALPFTKMATAGADYQTNPNTQIEWCIQYAKNRYKNPNNAKQFWIVHKWW